MKNAHMRVKYMNKKKMYKIELPMLEPFNNNNTKETNRPFNDIFSSLSVVPLAV